jgi:tetratricopeptide (TPR) repeat protein
LKDLPKPAEEKDGKDSLTLEFDIPPDHVAQGEKLESQGNRAGAAEAYQRAIQQDQRNVQAWWRLGNLYARAGQKAAAIQCLERALQLRPDNQALRDWLMRYKAR